MEKLCDHCSKHKLLSKSQFSLLNKLEHRSTASLGFEPTATLTHMIHAPCTVLMSAYYVLGLVCLARFLTVTGNYIIRYIVYKLFDLLTLVQQRIPDILIYISVSIQSLQFKTNIWRVTTLSAFTCTA